MAEGREIAPDLGRADADGLGEVLAGQRRTGAGRRIEGPQVEAQALGRGPRQAAVRGWNGIGHGYKIAPRIGDWQRGKIDGPKGTVRAELR